MSHVEMQFLVIFYLNTLHISRIKGSCMENHDYAEVNKTIVLGMNYEEDLFIMEVFRN